MSGYFDSWGNPPGTLPVVETYENEFTWGVRGLGLITGGTIDAAAIDAGNTPTYELRRGLLLGQKTATGTWTNYSPTATDGSQVAAGVLLTGLRMQQILSGLTQSKFYGILVGGPVKASALFGLDANARQQMSERFMFDDQLGFSGYHWFPFRAFSTKTANYTLTAGVSPDNFTVFDNTGAAGEVDITLPAIGPGYAFGFRVLAAQALKAISAEGGNLVGTTLTQSSVSGTAIGAGFLVYSNQAGTKWIVENMSSTTQALTYA